MSSIPMKMSILLVLNKNPDYSIGQIMGALEESYSSERQFTRKNFYHMLQGMRSMGLVKRTSVTLTEDGDLEARYAITPSGVDRLKFIPKRHLEEAI